MNQSEQIRKLLLAEKQELNLAPRTNDVAAPVGVAQDDQATILHDQFVALRMLGMDFEKLKLIDLALDRLAANEFGVCEDCGVNIPHKRLMAIPWATLCVSCQEQAGSTAGSERMAA